MPPRHRPININPIAVIIVLFVASLLDVCHADITIRRSKDDEKKLPTIELSRTACLSIAGFCEALGYTTRRNLGAQKLTCLKGTTRIVFSKDIPFYCVNDSLYQMPCGPLRRKETLYLPVWLCAFIFSRTENKTIEWNVGDSVVYVQQSAPGPEAADKTIGARPKAKKTAADNAEEPTNAQLSIKTIVIDPGHGGKDPGAIGPDGTREKDVVLSIALKLRDLLKKKSA